MRQVVQHVRSGRLAVEEVPAPTLRAGHLLVRSEVSLISPGTERMVVDFARKSLAGKAKARPDLVRKVMAKARRDGLAATLRAVSSRLDEPLPLGYSAAGSVVAVGKGLEGVFRVGERVAIAGAGLANHAELNLVPRNLAAPVPQDVPAEEACFGTLAAIALHGARNTQAGLGDLVAVVGVGLVGQLAVQLLALAGARVLALDVNPERLALAASLGAEWTVDLRKGDVEAQVSLLSGGRGCDSVLVAAASQSSDPLRTAGAVARDRARIVLVGATGTRFSFADFMKKELSVIVSRSYGPGRYDPAYEGHGVKYPEGWVRWTETENLAECVRLMSPSLPRRLEVAPLITDRFGIDEAEEAYRLVTGETTAPLGVVLTYDAEARQEGQVKSGSLRHPAPSNAGCVLGAIGAGNFARGVLLPELGKMPQVHLRTVVARRGAFAEQARGEFGFDIAATDTEAVLDDPEINAVLIATRHDSHAELTARALSAGKAVLVEKPLGLTRAQIDQVLEARKGSGAFFQVGFNRRFAPFSVHMRSRLSAAAGPKFILIRVNAGRLPADSWIEDPGEGGGRIVGEVCHFVDLARFLVDTDIVSVQADAARATDGPCDDLTATLRFNDGSLATIAYTALGDTAFSKERVEAYGGGSVIVLDNFRSLTVAENGRVSTERSRWAQDKGFADALEAFVSALVHGGPPPVDEVETIESSLATLAVLESLRSGARVDL